MTDLKKCSDCKHYQPAQSYLMLGLAIIGFWCVWPIFEDLKYREKFAKCKRTKKPREVDQESYHIFRGAIMKTGMTI